MLDKAIGEQSACLQRSVKPPQSFLTAPRPGAYIWHAAGGSWQMHLPPHKRVSKSWSIAGSHELAMRWVVKVAAVA